MHDSGLKILQALFEKITFCPIKINLFYILIYEGIPFVSRERGPGEIKKGTIDDVESMCKLVNKKYKYINRFKFGDNCVLGIIDGNIIGFEWYSTHPYHKEERTGYRIKIPNDSIYLYDAYIHEKYRIRGLWLKFKSYLAEIMRKTGKKRIITIIDFNNDLSIRTHERLGFKKFKFVLAMRLWKKSIFIEKIIS